MDNTRNFHGVAPDKGTLNGPVLTKANETYLLNHKGTPNLTSLYLNPQVPGFLEDRQSGDFRMADIRHGIVLQPPTSLVVSADSNRCHSTSALRFLQKCNGLWCKGDGTTDDTVAINLAISDGNRCGLECGSTTIAGVSAADL